MTIDLKALKDITTFNGSVEWRMTKQGLDVDGRIERTPGAPASVRRVWNDYKQEISAAADKHGVPAELIVATIMTESGGKARALRKEPGYKSDRSTPHRISPGIMQTLISTARSAMKDPSINRAWLMDPANSIMAGTAYIAKQFRKTGGHPPKVACAYNAGSVYKQNGKRNRWKMRQYPIGTGKHCDRFVEWFNDCFAMFDADGHAPYMSFHAMLNGTKPLPKISPPQTIPTPKQSLSERLAGLFRSIFRRSK